MWNDTQPGPETLVSTPPYVKDWNDACATEPTGNCADYHTLYPNPAPMIINTARLEPDNPLPPDLIWGQGPSFNNRLIQEINKEPSLVQFVIYRMTVANITNALLAKWAAGVQIQIMAEPTEYLNRKWPEFWLTHAYLDQLWAAGVPIKFRVHDGLTHMKTIVTSTYATNASSNYAAAWQRDVNYFVAQSAKPTIYQALKNRVTAMWNDPAAFGPFQPLPPDTPILAAPDANATGVGATPMLVWNRAPFATSYDVYFGTSSSNLTFAANVPAQLVNNPPLTYSWTTPTLQSGTTYFWRVVARTFATPVDATVVAPSSIRSFTTVGSSAPPAAPSSPSPSNSALLVGTSPTLGWSIGAFGTTFNVAFGASNPPPTVATGLTTSSFAPGTLSPSSTYYWRVTATSSGGTTQGPVWSFTTVSSGGATPINVVLYASDVTTTTAGTWTKTNDPTAAEATKLTNPDNAVAALTEPLPNPSNYIESTFDALGGTRYRVWLRIHAIGDQKWNDSVFVQFSDSVTSTGTPVYRTGTTSGYTVNLWTCADCQSVGWGWQRNAYWLADTGDVWFQNSGSHTIRVQNREDGVEIDQIVLSPTTYATNAPGPVSNDHTIVPKAATTGPAVPSAPNPADGAEDVSTSATLTWTSAGATNYDVRFGTSNPPPQVVTASPNASYTPALVSGMTYYWQVVARNIDGSTPGPTWSFTTVSAPAPPAVPGSPSPIDGATGVTTTPVLSWSAAGATTYDVRFGTTNPPSVVSSGQSSASYSPAGLANSATYFWQIVAHNAFGQTTGPVWSLTTQPPAPPAPDNIVIYASDVAPAALHGSWSSASDATSPNGTKLVTTDTGAASINNPLAAPVDYFDVTFAPAAGVPYRIWLRLKALNNSKFNDAVWLQFSDARANGSPVYPLNSTTGLLVNLATDGGAASLNGWGWQNGAYWLTQQTVVTFPTSGTQTLRIQIREDGVQLDQIVLSPGTYLDAAPGGVTNDSTIVPKPAPPAPPTAPGSPTPANSASGVSINPTLTWTSAGATSYDVRFGTSATPPTVSTGQATASYTPPALQSSTVYRWQIVARNAAGTTNGPIWSFTTAAPPPPPGAPGSPSPANLATGVITTPTLTWTATNATTFDVRFGTANPPPQVSAAQPAASYTPRSPTARPTSGRSSRGTRPGRPAGRSGRSRPARHHHRQAPQVRPRRPTSRPAWPPRRR